MTMHQLQSLCRVDGEGDYVKQVASEAVIDRFKIMSPFHPGKTLVKSTKSLLRESNSSSRLCHSVVLMCD